MQQRRLVTHLVAVTVLSLTVSAASACSAILLHLGGTAMMARNYDWHIGHALVIINQPGIAKRALSFDNPAEWTSKYGSVTINQYGREMPCDGINEAGLAIAVLWLDCSEYPASDHRPSVNTGQWVQYQLDTAATVEDVVESDNSLRITPYGGAKVHYFIADANGNCAVIEFLGGQMVAHRGDALPNRLITNSTCEQSCHHLAQYVGFGGKHALPPASDSLGRYVHLAKVATELKLENRPPYVVALESVKQVLQSTTQWQVAYDVKARTMYFRTQDQQAVRTIDLTQCDFDAENPALVLDIDAPLQGDILDSFREYTREANKLLVERSVAATEFTKNLPQSVIQLLINYPEVSCHPVSTAAVDGQ